MDKTLVCGKAASPKRHEDFQPCTAKEYLNRELRRLLFNVIKKFIRYFYYHDFHRMFAARIPENVLSRYDTLRNNQRSWASAITLDNLVYGNASYEDPCQEKRTFILIDDCIVWSDIREYRKRVVARLEENIRNFTSPGSVVVEFGSGDGRNLLHLKQILGNRDFIGLEFSPNSVSLAKDLSVRFRLPVTFDVWDVTSDIPESLKKLKADTVFSCHTLQEIPRTFHRALRNMLNIANKHVILFEPICELWPLDKRGIASRLEFLDKDYSRGIMTAISELTESTSWKLTYAERMRCCSSPLHETCEVHLVRLPEPC